MKANMLWNSAGSLVYFGFQWLLTVVVVRISGNYESAGVLALSMAVYNIVSPISVYRMFTYQISDVEHENSLGEYLTFRMITTAGAMVFAIVYSILTCPLDTIVAIVLYLAFKMSTQFIDSFHATMQLNGRMDYVGISNALQGACSFALFCAVFASTRSLELAFASMALAAIAVGLLYDLPRTTPFEPIKLGISIRKVRHLLAYCAPIVIAAIAMSAAPSIPRQYLAISQGEALLGIYASVAAPAAIIQMGASYVYTPLLSNFASFFSQRNAKAFTSLFMKTVGGIAAVGALSTVLLAFLGEWIIVFLFGESIAEHAYLLIPVIVCTIITAYLWFFNDLLIAIREFKGAFVGSLVALVATLASTIPFIDAFGANGVSFASIVGFALGSAIMAVYVLKCQAIIKAEGPRI